MIAISMTELAARWLPTLADGAVKGTIILGAAAALTALLRRRGAATRHLVWSAAVTAVLVLPALSLVAPRWSVPIAGDLTPPTSLTVPRALPSLPKLPATDSAEIASKSNLAAQGHILSLGYAPVADTVALQLPTTVTRRAPVLPNANVPSPGVGRVDEEQMPDGPSILTWLAIVWALGAFAVLTRLAVGTFGLARLVARSRASLDGSWLSLVTRLTRELGIRRPVTLLVGRTGTVPVTWGVVYPIVLLPADADAWSEERKRAVLLHELAHVERFDALTHVVSQLALAVFWFDPLVILAARRLRAERERACDDLVLAVGTRATAYAGDLLELVQTLGEASPAAAALAMARRSEFEGRLLAILDPAVPRARTSRRAAIVACAVAALTVVPLAGARAVARGATPPATTRAVVPDAVPHAMPRAVPHDAHVAERAVPTTTRVSTTRAAAAVAKSVAQPCVPRSGHHVSVSTSGATRSRTVIADSEHCLEVDVTGRVEFTDDDSDVASISPDGGIVVTETRGGVTREGAASAPNGRVVVAFKVNGAPVRDGETLAESSAWWRGVMRTLARESTVGVDARVARIRRERGVRGALDEAGRLVSDGARSAQVTSLLAGRPTDDELRQMAAVAGTRFSSDGDKASVLRAIAERAGNNPSVGMAVVTASNTIASDGDRRGVLSRVASRGDVTGGVLVYAVNSARSIASDGDKASLLRELAPRAGDLATLRTAIIDAAGTIASDGDRASVLTTLAPRLPDDATLVDALRCARGIASDGDKHAVLVALLPHTALAAGAARDAFFTTTDGIASDGDKAGVLLAVVRRPGTLAPTLAQSVLHSAAKIASDGDKASVLLAVADRPGVLDDASTRSTFLATLRTIASGSDYRRVMDRVAR